MEKRNKTYPPPNWEDGEILDSSIGARGLVDLVSERARAWPDALALVAGTESLTYRRLNALVDGWARYLSENDVFGRPAGICVSATPACVIGFLALLRAGAVVVPLDPMLPRERLRMLAEGVSCGVILTDEASEGVAPSGRGPPLRLDRPPPPAVGPAVWPAVDPDSPACLYHTSGTTGRPKPVVLSHRALSARMLSMADWFELSQDEVVCGASSIGFDPFLQQMFFPLIRGGTLWLPERAALLDPNGFWPLAAELGVTHLNLVPSQIEALLAGRKATGRGKRRSPCRTLRRIVLGGERLSAGLADRIAAVLGSVPLYNMYGPTEATVDATGYRIGSADEGEGIPIGRPLPGCHVRILDDDLVRLPIGAVGEVCIGGVGLALGYRDLPEATAERFAADPYGAAGDRLYRTGDRAFWRPDGEIAFVGRTDDQIKIRGQRIELGEVEAVLRQCPGVQGAVVSRWEAAPGGPALIAHVVGGPDEAALRAVLARQLPAAAVPVRILSLDALPLLPSGKADRRALPAPEAPRPASPADGALLHRAIAGVWGDLLGRAIDPEANLFEMGAHSLLVPRALIAIEAATGRRVSSVDLFRFPSVAALARHLAGDVGERLGHRSSGQGGDIAVIGMAFRFPGADRREDFWSNLIAAADSARRFDRAALLAAGAPAALVDHPEHVPVHGAIEGVDRFDAPLFGYGQGEAAEIDPQQRLLLRLAWHALEDAGCNPAADGPVGVFAGVGFNAYLLDNLRERTGFAGGIDRYSAVVASDKDFAATRLAYKLDLTGPAMTVNTACSTALSATAMAVDSLRAGRCRVALAGAASLGMFSPHGYIHADGGIASRAGRCRPFDAAADGTIGGAGGAVLVLKRLDEAVQDGDTVHGVIRGVGVANDGAAKAAFSAPSVEGQAGAIAAALADAGVAPGEVGFVEGHGTGTALGDPIEVAALNIAYRGGEQGSILLGSVKGNVGHLDAAAGMAGLIKALLALRHGQVPPTAHFTQANPAIPFADGPFRVNAVPESWPGPAGRLRIAGVSAFGMGGTNIHLVIGAPPPSEPEKDSSEPALILLSAATPTAFGRLSASLADHLTAEDAPALEAIAGSLSRRRPLKLRQAVVARDRHQAAEALRELEPPAAGVQAGMSAAFLFPGQGAQHPGMGRDLYRTVAAVRATFDEAAAILAGSAVAGLVPLLLAEPGDAAAAAALAETEMTQPALFVLEVAIARALGAFGVRPAALIGHSVGEYVAACLAGVMDFAAALRLVAARGRLMATAPRGAMLAVSLSEERLAPILAAAGADLAAVNGPLQCVAAGTEEQIAAVADAVAALGKTAKRLAVSHAFHSALMEPILDDFAREVRQVKLAPPRLPVLSNVTGDWLTAEMATDAAYWVRHLRGTVRFADGLKNLTAEPRHLLVEVGPGLGLSRLARAGGVSEARVVSTQPEASAAVSADGRETLLRALGRLWSAGIPVTVPAARRVPLPPYPFDEVRLWIEPGAAATPPMPGTSEIVARLKPAVRPSATDAQAMVAEIWRDVLGGAAIGPDDDFLALGGDSLIAVRIAARLRERFGCEVSVETVFRGGTVAGLAGLLDSGTRIVLAAPREEGFL